jgi:hypothetical protein
MSDPLTDIVTLLNPRPTHTKLVEGRVSGALSGNLAERRFTAQCYKANV